MIYKYSLIPPIYSTLRPLKYISKERKNISNFESVCIGYITLHLKILLCNKNRYPLHFQCNLLYKYAIRGVLFRT